MILSLICVVFGVVSSQSVLVHFPEFVNLTEKVTTIEEFVTRSVTSMKNDIASLTGVYPAQVIYTRWGRSDCNNSKLLYDGYVAGGYWNNYGSAANYLCLVKDPSYTSLTKKRSWFAGIYGAQYEDNVFGSNHQTYEVPCAVCVDSPATSVVMIPGKKDCPTGMKFQYWGLLSAGAYDSSAAGEYICMDISPQMIGSKYNHEGAILLPVQTQCGSLPCPPYKQDKLVTCVVCTK